MTKCDWQTHISDDVLDLSMLQLTEYPIKNKLALPKTVTTLNVSNNLLVNIPPHICTIIHIQVMDLSKNKLKGLPQQFGDLVNLKRLDLYDNQLTCLPLSFYKLQKLRWLDVSSNPLSQGLKSIAGACENARECENAARNVVRYFGLLSDQVGKEVRENLLKTKSEPEAPAETKQDTKIKKQKKNKTFDKKVSDANENVQEKSSPSAASMDTKKAKTTSLGRYIFFLVFMGLAIAVVYIWGKKIDLDSLKQCIRTGQKCTQLILQGSSADDSYKEL